ncbi:MAG: rRNA maturation RNase YbeY [Planctomycetota bacterium]|jgi:probable rRNA maturation factor
MTADRIRFNDLQDRPVDGKLLTRLLDFVLDRNATDKIVSLAVVDDGRITELNVSFKGHEGPTDVLAFPLEDPAAPDPDPELGEIVISADTAARQAEELGHTPEKEMCLLAVHGLLHLLGRDDADPAQRQSMLAEGEALLEAFSAQDG